MQHIEVKSVAMDYFKPFIWKNAIINWYCRGLVHGCLQQNWWCLLLVGSVIAIVAMAAIVYGANVDFSGALLYNEGPGADGNLFGVAEELMSDSVNKTYTIKLITIDIKDGVIAAIDGVQDILKCELQFENSLYSYFYNNMYLFELSYGWKLSKTLSFHTKNNLLAFGDERGCIHLWNVFISLFNNNNNKLQIKTINKWLNNNNNTKNIKNNSNKYLISKMHWHWHSHAISCITFTTVSNDSHAISCITFTSGGEESVLVLTQLETQRQQYVPRLGGKITFITVSNDEIKFVIGLNSNKIHIIDSINNKIIKTIVGIDICKDKGKQIDATEFKIYMDDVEEGEEADQMMEVTLKVLMNGIQINISPSKSSKPLRIHTPKPPTTLPAPNDPGFCPYKTDEILYVIKEYLQFSEHPFIATYKIPTGKLSPLKPNTSYQITVYTSRNNIDSAESKAIQIMTPNPNFYQMNNHKPSPLNQIQQIYDKDNDEIILMRQLPKYTTLDLPQQKIPLSQYELPVRTHAPQNDVNIKIITVSQININNEPNTYQYDTKYK